MFRDHSIGGVRSCILGIDIDVERIDSGRGFLRFRLSTSPCGPQSDHFQEELMLVVAYAYTLTVHILLDTLRIFIERIRPTRNTPVFIMTATDKVASRLCKPGRLSTSDAIAVSSHGWHDSHAHKKCSGCKFCGCHATSSFKTKSAFIHQTGSLFQENPGQQRNRAEYSPDDHQVRPRKRRVEVISERPQGQQPTAKYSEEGRANPLAGFIF